MTGSNVCMLTNARLIGGTVAAAGAVTTMNPTNAKQLEASGDLTRLDYSLSDLSASSYTKNGGATVALAGTTAKTIDLTNLTSVVASYAGDTVFASVNKLILKNLGAGSLTVAPGGSNPFDLGLGGTTPTLTIPAGSSHTLEFAAGKTVDSTHKTILITPAADTTFSIAVGGA